jgi:hypothetical protein
MDSFNDRFSHGHFSFGSWHFSLIYGWGTVSEEIREKKIMDVLGSAVGAVTHLGA